MKNRIHVYVKKDTVYTLRTVATQHNVSLGEAVDILIENYKNDSSSDKLAEHIADIVCKRMEEKRLEDVKL